MSSCTVRLAFSMESAYIAVGYYFVFRGLVHKRRHKVPSHTPLSPALPASTAVCAKHRAKRMRTCPVIAVVGLGLPSVAGFVAPNVGAVRVSGSERRQPPIQEWFSSMVPEQNDRLIEEATHFLPGCESINYLYYCRARF